MYTLYIHQSKAQIHSMHRATNAIHKLNFKLSSIESLLEFHFHSVETHGYRTETNKNQIRYRKVIEGNNLRIKAKNVPRITNSD